MMNTCVPACAWLLTPPEKSLPICTSSQHHRSSGNRIHSLAEHGACCNISPINAIPFFIRMNQSNIYR